MQIMDVVFFEVCDDTCVTRITFASVLNISRFTDDLVKYTATLNLGEDKGLMWNVISIMQ